MSSFFNQSVNQLFNQAIRRQFLDFFRFIPYLIPHAVALPVNSIVQTPRLTLRNFHAIFFFPFFVFFPSISIGVFFRCLSSHNQLLREQCYTFFHCLSFSLFVFFFFYFCCVFGNTFSTFFATFLSNNFFSVVSLVGRQFQMQFMLRFRCVQ